MKRKSAELAYELEITRWVEWYRGVNDPETQWKVAERQLNMLKAEKRIVHWEAVYDSHRGPQVILHVANKLELEQLTGYLPKVFPKVPHGPLECEDRERFRNERGAALENMVELISHALQEQKKGRLPDDAPLKGFLKWLGDLRARKGRR